MTKLEKMIKEHCPNGVEFVPLGEVCSLITKGTTPSVFEKNGISFIKTEAFEGTRIDKNKLSFINEHTHNNELKRSILQVNDILFAIAGTIGKCAIVTEDILPANTNQALAIIRLTNRAYRNYIMHVLQSRYVKDYILKSVKSSAQPNLNLQQMNNFSIPLPPFPVQQELARILDLFVELEIETISELEARKKQYEYYRNELLFFSYNLPRVELGKICTISAGGTPQKGNNDYWENGTIKWLGSTVCKNQKFIDEVTNYITLLGMKNSSAKLLKQGTTLIAMVGATIGKVAFLNFEATTNQNVAAVYPLNKNVLNESYLFYICQNLYPIFENLSSGGKLAIANLSFIRSLEVPLPPLEEQERIVSILDRFETLTNDLTNGLPAEIAARKKQYEYYRDKLLMF